jgi:CRISPR-associated protein Csb1
VSLGQAELDHWLCAADRLVVRCRWTPVLGEHQRFQPTNFPNLGAAEYSTDGGRTVVVDSPQSMANRLEALSWDAASRQPTGPFQGLPYVVVMSKATKNYLTSSRTEAHRLSGAYLRDAKTADGEKWDRYLNDRFGLSQTEPMDLGRVYREIYALDPYCLIHGVFFSDKDIWGQPKVPRALTATMDAFGAQPVTSGGVKKDDVGARNEFTGGSVEGYGMIIYPRVDYTARRIESLFVLDVDQIRRYGLDAAATETLFLLGLWEIAAYCARPRRHRTLCDLNPQELVVEVPASAHVQFPTADALERLIADHVRQEPAAPLVLWHQPTGRASKAADRSTEGED